MRPISALLIAYISMSLLVAVSCAKAASYPAKPVRIITTSLPGSSTDVVARAVGTRLSELWGQQFVIENRSGAGGQIAAEMTAHATPDGYTLLYSSDGPVAISPALKRKLPYDPLKNFEPVAFGIFNDYILVVNPTVAVHSVSDLLKLARSNSSKLRYGSAGVGSPNHLGMELFRLKAGIDLVHIPYKGGPAVVVDLLAGQIELAMLGPPSIPHVKAGRLRAIAVPGATRSELMPDLPPIADTVPGVDVRTWGAFFAPMGTPKAILEKLHQAITAQLSLPETKKVLALQGLRAEAMTRNELRALVSADIKKYTELVRALKIPLTE